MTTQDDRQSRIGNSGDAVEATNFDFAGELPVRPRRGLLKPLPVGLMAALAAACGFIAGVQVQKQQGSSASAGASSSIASRLRALRSLGSSASLGAAGGLPGAGSAGFPGATAGGGGASSGFTSGEVSYIRGSTLYVTNGEGTTVKVNAAAAKVTKTVSAAVRAIHPGETVTVLGRQEQGGAIEASSLAIGANASRSGSGGTAGGTASGAGTATLFGSG